MEPRRLADIRAGDERSTRSVGTGYLVAPRLVLTARHTVVDAGTGEPHPRIDLRIGHPRRAPAVWRDGGVCWTGGADSDVALVRLREAVEIPDSMPVRWGRPTGVRPLPYEGLGYPRLAEYADDERGVETLRGVLPPLSTGPGGMFVLDQAAGPRARPGGAAERAWAGVSGAAVFCHGFLVGIVVRDDAEYDNRRLHACPTEAFALDTAFASLLSRYGAGPLRIEDIPEAGGPGGPVPSAGLMWPPTSDAAAPEGTVGGLWSGRAVGADPATGPDTGALPDHLPVTARRTPVRLPPAPTAFVGRNAEERTVLEFLEPRETAGPSATSVLITGMGGVGKTALALHAAREAHGRGWFRGGMCFLNARGYGPGPAVGATDLAGRLLGAFGLGGVAGDPEHAAEIWHELLTGLERNGTPVLVVLDDVADVGQVAELVPGPSRHRMVITSRDVLTGLDAGLVQLAVLPADESVTLIDVCLRIAHPADRRFAERSRDTLRVAELCGGLPLALHTMASLLGPERNLTAGDLADELADTRMRLDALSSDGIDAPVRAAFDVSYRRLTEGQAQTFRSLSVHPGSHVAGVTAAALVDRTPPVARRALRSLARAHLVESVIVPGATDAWAMHSLLRIYAQEQAGRHPVESEAVRKRLYAFYQSRVHAASRALSGAQALGREGEFASSQEAMNWLNSERTNAIAVGLLALSDGRGDVAFDIVFPQLEIIAHPDLGKEFLPLTERVVEWARAEDNPATQLNALVIHTGALISAGRPQEAVAPLRSMLGVTRSMPEREGVVRLTLSMAYRGAGRLPEAVAQSRAAVSLFDEVGDLGNKSSALTSLGNSLRLLDRPEEAAEAHRRAAEAVGAVGGSTYLEAVCLNNLGNALSDMGEKDQSIAAFRRSVDLFREYGFPHMGITTAANLGGVLAASGRQDEAAEVWSGVAELCHDVGEPAREFVALAEAGRALQEIEDYSALLDVSCRAVACSGSVENQTHAAQVMNNLAFCQSQTGALAESVVGHVRAAVHFAAHPDADEPDAGENQIILAMLAADRITDRGDAGEVLLRAAELAGGARHPDWEGRLRFNAGNSFATAERYDESVAALRSAAEVLRSAGDEVRQGCALNNLGIGLRELQRYEESAEAILEDIAICRAAGDQAGEATSLLNLAETLGAGGDTEGATAHRHEALDILIDVEGDPETIAEVRREIALGDGPRPGGTRTVSGPKA
ncbi:tetratricopeptide repeat protein [Streptomyces sp. NPDC055962]|uniref:tetratricopeptide repeat protein n=1 Tax=Streptomyces sp. NPDC055962 TaxID=3345667 RepID=UPI0035DF7971